MEYIRQAVIKDVSRIAEILVFTKRMNYRRIFHNDKVSFGEIQVYPLAQDLLEHPDKGMVRKGMIDFLDKQEHPAVLIG